MSQININLNEYISSKDTALVGREYGKVLLGKVVTKVGDLCKLDYDQVIIIIPKRIVTMNKSFFLGFFEGIITEIGKDSFLSKYVFEASEYIVSKVPSYTDSALLTATMKDILDV